LSTSRFTPVSMFLSFFFQAEDGIRDFHVTGVQTCALPISEATAGPRGLPRKVTTTDNTTRSGPFIQVGPLRSRLHQVAEGRAGEIGRASCRERGWVSVVAGPGKKKKNQ